MLFDLVFEGGGVRGIAFLGALEALADNGHTFDRLMGTSVGGLTAALLATGHDVRSMRDLIFNPQSGRLAFSRIAGSCKGTIVSLWFRLYRVRSTRFEDNQSTVCP